MSTTLPASATSTTEPVGTVAPTSARGLWWAGLVLAIAVVVAFYAQVAWANRLLTPWYLPIGGTIAALLLLAATIRSPRWWRFPAVALIAALAALEWLFVLVVTVLPGYGGPVAAGAPLPAFQATLADGSPIDASHFAAGRPSVIVFFQGRWCPFCMTQLRELESHQGEFSQAGADVYVVSLEDQSTAAETQREFPHLHAVSDERRELSNAVDLINRGFAPDGSDCATPTVLVLDGQGKVQWVHRPERFIARPSAAELVAVVEQRVTK